MVIKIENESLGSFLLFVKSIKALSKKREKTVAILRLLSYFGSLSTVVGDEKLTSRENRIGFLFLYVQSDEDTLLKVDEVSKTEAQPFNVFEQLISSSSFEFEQPISSELMKKYLVSVVYSPTCEYDLGKLLLHEFQHLFFHIIIVRFDQYLLCIFHNLSNVDIWVRTQYDTYNSI